MRIDVHPYALNGQSRSLPPKLGINARAPPPRSARAVSIPDNSRSPPKRSGPQRSEVVRIEGDSVLGEAAHDDAFVEAARVGASSAQDLVVVRVSANV